MLPHTVVSAHQENQYVKDKIKSTQQHISFERHIFSNMLVQINSIVKQLTLTKH